MNHPHYCISCTSRFGSSGVFCNSYYHFLLGLLIPVCFSSLWKGISGSLISSVPKMCSNKLSFLCFILQNINFFRSLFIYLSILESVTIYPANLNWRSVDVPVMITTWLSNFHSRNSTQALPPLYEIVIMGFIVLFLLSHASSSDYCLRFISSFW